MWFSFRIYVRLTAGRRAHAGERESS
jgi:hypothetical protein